MKAREMLETIRKIDHLLDREEHDSGYAAFVHMRKIWPDLKRLAAQADAPARCSAESARPSYAEGEAPWSEDEQFEERAKACKSRTNHFGRCEGDGDYEGQCDGCSDEALEVLHAAKRPSGPRDEPQAARETLTDEQVYYAARKLALALPDMYENANHKGSLVPNTAALTVARMMLDAAIRLGAPLSGKPGEQPQAAQGGWEQAFLLSAEVADSMGRAAAHANVYGRLSEAYWAVETSIKQLLEQVKKGETVTNNNGLPVSFSIPQTVRQPIETAPKDGTHILAWRIPIGIRVTNNTHPPTVVHWFNDPEEPGFYTSVNELAPEHPYNPTHWMPIP
jgi:hypothetical protein